MGRIFLFALVFIAVLLSFHSFSFGAQSEKEDPIKDSPNETVSRLGVWIRESGPIHHHKKGEALIPLPKEKSDLYSQETPVAKTAADPSLKIVPSIIAGQSRWDHGPRFREAERSSEADILRSLTIVLEFVLKF